MFQRGWRMALCVGRGLWVLVASVALAAMSPSVMAQIPKRGDTVTDRERPDFDPKGVKLGGFRLLPQLGVSGVYDDNILASDTGTKDDFIALIEPSAMLKSNWSQHLLQVEASGEIAKYASNSNEDYEDFSVGTLGRADVTRDMYIQASLDFDADHESRSSPDDPGGVEPTEFSRLHPSVTLFNRWNRVSVTLGGNSQIIDFDDSVSATGAVLDNDDRDRTTYAGDIRIGYEIVPEYEAFIKSSYNKISYDDAVDSSGFNRDSDGYEIVGGVRIDLGGALSGDVFGGYRRQDYDDPTLVEIDGATWGGALTWNASGLTTVKASVTRDVVETTQVGASGYFSTEYKASVDHELLRNLILGGYGAFTINDYKGNGRDDDDINAGVYARYLMHRNLYLSASYNFEKRESDLVGADFEKNVFMLRLSTQF